MSPAKHRFVGLYVLAALLAFSFGCSSKHNKIVTPHIFSQNDADDIMQQVGISAALDLGGWMVDLHSTVNSTPHSPAGLRYPAPARVLRDSTFTVAGITYTVNYGYVWSGVPHAQFSDSAEYVEVVLDATGTFNDPHLQGSYWHHSDFTVDSVNTAFSELVINGSVSDSLLSNMHSIFRGDSAFLFVDNFFSYDSLRVAKDLGTHPYPLGGSLDMLLDENVLNSLSLGSSIKRGVNAEIFVQFDGTQTPNVTIADDLNTPSAVFHYKLNLQTGVVTRSP